MSWVQSLSLAALALFLVCVAIVLYCVIRDRQNRGMRISNQEIQRENVTISIPFSLRDFK